MQPAISTIFGNRVRVRVCGLCWRADRLLVVNHRGLSQGDFWAPPGGGVEFGASIEETLVREFGEETGLTINVGPLRLLSEHIRPPLHAVELFFDVSETGGELITGIDPEMSEGSQLIAETRFMDYGAIRRLAAHERHAIFDCYKTESELKMAVGLCRI